MRRRNATTIQFTACREHSILNICLWSGPRNVSTALMYSFAQRSDTRVVDEPLYGHYLRVSGAVHPGGDEVLATVNCDGDAVMRTLLKKPGEQEGTPEKAVTFIKQMAHHLVALDRGFLQSVQNAFLIRDPRDMLPSLTVQIPEATLKDTGLETQWRLFEKLQHAGHTPTIIDSRELLLDPAVVLAGFCERLGLAFDPAMLRWDAGPRPEDGIWARHWYSSVHRSTGFMPYREKDEFPAHLNELLDECRPYYENLYAHALRSERT